MKDGSMNLATLNPLNTSKTKQMFSFEKSDRFKFVYKERLELTLLIVSVPILMYHMMLMGTLMSIRDEEE
jgi:hypothetical protein